MRYFILLFSLGFSAPTFGQTAGQMYPPFPLHLLADMPLAQVSPPSASRAMHASTPAKSVWNQDRLWPAVDGGILGGAVGLAVGYVVKVASGDFEKRYYGPLYDDDAQTAQALVALAPYLGLWAGNAVGVAAGSRIGLEETPSPLLACGVGSLLGSVAGVISIRLASHSQAASLVGGVIGATFGAVVGLDAWEDAVRNGH